LEFDAKELGGRVTMVVTIRRYNQWCFRIWLGVKLIRLAAWIMWMNVEIEEQ
jgi:hypothetical protein